MMPVNCTLFQSTSSIQRKTIARTRQCWIIGISIHFLYTEEDQGRDDRNALPLLFQSTSSIQRKTPSTYKVVKSVWHFNPLPLYRGRPLTRVEHVISCKFQSTSSIQRKTSLIILDIFRKSISIHFLYTEEDSHRVACFRVQFISIHFLYTEEDVMDNDKTIKETDFNPLPLYRGRLILA